MGIIGSRLGLPILDPICGIIVALLITRIGYQTLATSFRELTDQATDQRVADSLSTVARQVDGVRAVSQVRTRNMGPYTVADLQIVVNSHLSVSAGHVIAERVRMLLMDQFPRIAEVLVHVDAAPHAVPMREDAADAPLYKKQEEQDHHHDHHHHNHDHDHNHDHLSSGHVDRDTEIRLEETIKKVCQPFEHQLKITHILSHYLEDRWFVEINFMLVHQEDYVQQAKAVAKQVRALILSKVPELGEKNIEMHLELTDEHEQFRN